MTTFVDPKEDKSKDVNADINSCVAVANENLFGILGKVIVSKLPELVLETKPKKLLKGLKLIFHLS